MVRKRLWLGIVVVVAAALAFAGPSIIAGMSNTAVASSGCGMDMGSSGGGCSMMGGSDGADKGSMQMAHGGCAMLTGTAVAVDKRDGSITVKVKPAAAGADVTQKALNQVKVGDTLSMGMMLGKDGKPAAANTGATVQTAKYACPMHPEVTSDKPGKCPKCGMDLEPTGGGQK